MRSLLVIISLFALVINSQAATLTEHDRGQLHATSRKPPSTATGVIDYHRPRVQPPPAPKLIEMITISSNEHSMFRKMKNYGKEEHRRPPPSPKEAPPTHQVTGGGRSAVENKLWKLNNYGKEEHRSPPAPKEAPPTHQVNYGKKGGGTPPPTPQHAPPTHQVSGGGGGGGAAASEQYVLLSSSA